MKKEEKLQLVPVWEKALLTVEEATAYFGIGINKLKELSNDPNSNIALWVGRKCLLKRKALEEYLENLYSI
jgi:hypothetical protein